MSHRILTKPCRKCGNTDPDKFWFKRDGDVVILRHCKVCQNLRCQKYYWDKRDIISTRRKSRRLIRNS